MPKHIPEEVINEIRSRIDIVEIVAEHVMLTKSGSNYTGLCPFHSEKSPSFTVSPDKQLFYCFGCGTGGNVFNFLMLWENYSFPEAVEYLAKRTGVLLPDGQERKVLNKDEEYRKRLCTINSLAARFYNYLLTEHELGEKAREYLLNRGVSKEMIEEFQLGYAPDSWNAVLSFGEKRGFTPGELVASGLASESKNKKSPVYFDRFRNRVMFPIYDERGRVLGFGGRELDGGRPKYLNTPETVLFHKGSVLYGLHKAARCARKKGRAVIVEGYMDVITAHQFGFEETVASLGTAFTREQARLIVRNAREAVLVFDGDAAGETAALKSVEILEEQGCKVRIASLNASQDPDDFLKENGAKAFDEILERAVPVLDYKLSLCLQRYPVKTIKGKVEAVNFILKDLIRIESAVEREEYIELISKKLALSREALYAELKRTRNVLQKYGTQQDKKVKFRHTRDGSNLEKIPSCCQVERELLEYLFNDPSVWHCVQYELDIEAFEDDAVREVIEALIEYKKLEREKESSGLPPADELVNLIKNESARSLLAKVQVEQREASSPTDRINDIIYYLKIRNLQKMHSDKEEELRKREKNGQDTLKLLKELNDIQRTIEKIKRERSS